MLDILNRFFAGTAITFTHPFRDGSRPGDRLDQFNVLIDSFSRELGNTASTMHFPAWAAALETYFLTRTQGLKPSELRQARRFCRWHRRTIDCNHSALERDRLLLVAAEQTERERFRQWLTEFNERQANAAAQHPKQITVSQPVAEPLYDESDYVEPVIEHLRDRRSIYRQLLRDPRWQRKRLEVFQRDAWMCQNCHATDRTLHVHHLHYRCGCLPWEYDMSELATLCESCHKQQHFEAYDA